ncbi:hypothetical protein CTEN210_16306 [Chaetoceros tenuissimus]|uniref:Polycomb protein VEFS-Box domain-containing protein n=1 Tax=Chaetoceros tenuissimus TaxID=426638 RepID=A0AAD3DBC3_9STRA|nr:hypothetical protein CTEN210_16306 [Chaetoceros tenuissimus]
MTYVNQPKEPAHSFNQLFRAPVLIAKRLQFRWFNEHKVDISTDEAVSSTVATKRTPSSRVKVTRVPFLSRNLSYNIYPTRQNMKPLSKTLLNSRSLHKHGKRDSKYHKIYQTYKRRRREEQLKLYKRENLLDVFDILKKVQKDSNYSSKPCIKPCKKFPPYEPFELKPVNDEPKIAAVAKSAKGKKSRKEKSRNESDAAAIKNPPHPFTTAYSLFKNKIRNSNDQGDAISDEKILEMWNALEDHGKFWMEEARWDQRRYRYQKALYDRTKERTLRGEVFFSYLYYERSTAPGAKNGESEKNVSLQQERRQDRRCSLCFVDGRTDEGLFMHCNSFHGQGVLGDLNIGQKKRISRDPECRLSFEAGIDWNRNVHILVKSYHQPEDTSFTSRQRGDSKDDKEEYQFVFHRNKEMQIEKPHELPFVPLSDSMFLSNKERKRNINKLKQLTQHGDETMHPEASTQFIPNAEIPIRTYYHPKTMQPMGVGEWDIDSDDEIDQSWEDLMKEKTMKEFLDVTLKEKKLFSLWNNYLELIPGDKFLLRKKVPKLCIEFVTKTVDTIIEEDLRFELLLHYMNLWDNQLISNKIILFCMNFLDRKINAKRREAENSTVSNLKRKRDAIED